jgi:hypothetical protein
MAPKREKCLELRIYVSETDQKPADLSRTTGAIVLVPKDGKPLKKDLQLMTPESAPPPPTGKAHPFPGGQLLRLDVTEFSKPFETVPAEKSGASPYFKADVPAEQARNSEVLTVVLQTPAGKQKVEIPSPFGR